MVFVGKLGNLPPRDNGLHPSEIDGFGVVTQSTGGAQQILHVPAGTAAKDAEEHCGLSQVALCVMGNVTHSVTYNNRRGTSSTPRRRTS